MNYSSGHESKQIKCQVTCTALEKQEKLRFLTLRVLLLQNKASESGIIFWDTSTLTFYLNSSIEFTVSKDRGNVKYGYR